MPAVLAMMPRGIPLAQIRSDLEADAKVRLLARRVEPLTYYAALGVYISITLTAWANASREPDPAVVELMPPETMTCLISVGLLADDGGITQAAFDRYIGSVLAARRRDADRKVMTPAERQAAHRLRNRIFERDAYTCRYCGGADYPRELLVMEHIDPRGGRDESNLLTACRPCNGVKGDRTAEEAGMVILPIPSPASRDVTKSHESRVTRDSAESRGVTNPALRVTNPANSKVPKSHAESRNVTRHEKSRGTYSTLLYSNVTEIPLPGNDGGVQGGGDADPVSAYYTLTTRYPKGNALAWVKRLGDTYGFEQSSTAMASTWAESDDIGTLLSRTEDRLVATERAAELREKAEERERLRRKRATVRAPVVDPGPERVGAIMGDIRKALGR